MAFTYEDIFILDLFSIHQPKKGTTVFHILQGKRTASILYRSVDYALESFFGFFPQLNRSAFHKRLNRLVSMDYLTFLAEKEEFIQTTKGKSSVESYYREHYRPTHLTWLTKGQSIKEFQQKIYFLTQVFSEMRHQNKRYIPVEKNVAIQQWVKLWISHQATEPQALASEFGLEWKRLLSKLDEKNATILVNLMTGYQTVGLTKAQLSQLMHIEELEVTIRQYDSLSYLVTLISDNSEEVPLFASIVQEILHNNENGLSKSAKETYILLKRGLTTEEICHYRKLKKSTISEHIIELVLLFSEIDIKTFMPNTIYRSLKQCLTDFPEISFQEVSEKMPGMDFLWYRLMQIERRRMNEKTD